MLYDKILQIEREITSLTLQATRVSLIGSTLGVRTVEDHYEIYCMWHDEEARILYDNILALVSERSVELEKLKHEVK